MQNKQALIGIVAAAVILLGAGGVFLLNKNKTSNPQPNNTTSTGSQTSNQTSMMQSTISDIFSSGENKKCDFQSGEVDNQTQGTFYVAGNKAYGDLKTTTNGKSSSMYIIRSEDTFYLWGDSLPTGMKMTMSVEEMASKMNSSQTSTFDPNQKVDFKCSTWSVDNSKFTPPSNVKFTDLGDVMQGSKAPTGGATNSNSTSSCSICASLTGAAKTACLQTYNCQ